MQKTRDERFEIEVIDVTELVADLGMQIRRMLPPEIKLEIKLGHALPIIACCRERFRNAIVQLLSNAHDGLPVGGAISLTASARHRGDLVSALELYVSDNGVGMETNTLRRATEPFFTTKTTGLGGLGLTIVSQFAEEAGGKFGLESEFGIGTRATLLLPVALN